MSILTSESLLPDCAGTSVDCNMNEPDGEKEVNMNNHQTKTTHADKSDLESADGEEQPIWMKTRSNKRITANVN